MRFSKMEEDNSKRKITNIKQVVSQSDPVFEVMKPFCSCGKELSSIYYEMKAKQSFNDVMKDMVKDIDPKYLDFFHNFDEILSLNTDIKFCCKLNLRAGWWHPLSLEDPREGARRDQTPVSLPSALNRKKTIYWAS